MATGALLLARSVPIDILRSIAQALVEPPKPQTLKFTPTAFLAFFAFLLASPHNAFAGNVDPKTHKLCSEAKDYAGCVKAMTTNLPEEDTLTSLRNAMKQVAGRLRFGTTLADSTATFQPVVDQLALVESREPSSLAVKTAREAVQLFDILQTAWKVRIASENTAFRGASGDLRVYDCARLKATADAFNASSTGRRIYFDYTPSPLFGHTCKVSYGQEPDAKMYPIIISLLQEGSVSPEEIKAKEKAEADRKAKAEKERALCAMEPWNRYLEENPGMKKWAEANPSAAQTTKVKFLADPKNQTRCSVQSQYNSFFDPR